MDYVTEDEPLGTIGPVVANLDRFPDHFLVMNGDVLTDLDYGAVLERHSERQPALTIATYRRQVPIEFGVLETDDDQGRRLSREADARLHGQHGRQRDLAVDPGRLRARRAARLRRPRPASARDRRADRRVPASTATGSTSDGPRTTTRRTRTTRGCGRSCSGSEVSGVLVIGAAGLIGRAVLAEAERTGTVDAVVAQRLGGRAGRARAAAVVRPPSTRWRDSSSGSSRQRS